MQKSPAHRGCIGMASDPQHQVRERLNLVLLALQILARQSRPQAQQQRIAQIGLASARRLTALVLNGRAHPSPET